MHRPLVIAHRGNSSVAPENTLAAFRSALELGVDGVELDYHHSADGVPVVFHDETLDRCTNASVLWGRAKIGIAECTVESLRKLDAGSWFGSDRKFADEPIATLDEALDLICGAGATCVIERKAGNAETLVALLSRKQLVDRVVVMAFDWGFLADCHRLEASLRLVALGDGRLNSALLDAIAALPAKIVGWDQRSLDPPKIASIHSRGWQAWTWTVDQAQRMEQLIDAQIDAITSNRPQLLLEVLSR